MRFHVVTTTNAEGWDQTGRRMAQSFVERWTDEAHLTVYAEGFDVDVEGISARRLPIWLDAFKEKWGGDPKHTGFRRQLYDYRFDAVKFAHKVAALTDFGCGLDDGVMIWLDADTFTHADVTPKWLDGLFPAPSYIAWLDRQNSHPECGFVMFRCSHKYHHQFMEAFRELYVSGSVLGLPETHDSFALQHLVGVKVWNRMIEPPVSLSGETRWHHPFVSGPLGACLDHMKGPRKFKGKSDIRDLRRPRPEAYWNA